LFAGEYDDLLSLSGQTTQPQAPNPSISPFLFA